MATSCTTTATATTTSVITVDSLITTFTESVSTALPTTTTITTSECLGSLSLLCISTATTLTSTIPGTTTTIQVPVTETVPVISSQTITLFGTACTTFASSSSSVSVSLTPSTSTPDPTTYTTSSTTTLSNGQVSTIVQTITSTASPSIVLVPTNVPGENQAPQQNTDAPSPSSNVGPIVGGVLGGFFLLLGVALIIWFIMKRRRRWDDIFDKEDTDMAPPRNPRPTKRFSLDADIEPKPYQYGLVGQSRSPTIGVSPPGSPPGFRPSATSPPPGRQHTLTPLKLPMSASTPGPSAGTISSRPSTANSMRPLRDASVPGSPPPPLMHSHTTSSGSSTSVHVAPALPSHWGHHSPSPSAGQEYFDRERDHPFEQPRSGSPTSVRDYEPQLRLKLANLGDDEVAQSLGTQGALAHHDQP